MQKTNFTGLVNTVNEVFHSEAQQMYFMKEAYEPYVEFRMFSSVFITENDDVWMVFPRIHNNSVTDLVAAVLSENATQLHYYDIDRSSDFYENNIAAFQKSFSNSELSSTHSSPCGFEDRPPCDIEIVIIQFPNPISYIPPSGVNNIGGGCSPYVMCVYDDNGGGGSGSSPISGLPGQNPCDKIKKVGKNQKTKDLMEDLKTKTGDDKEHGSVLVEENNVITPFPVTGNPGQKGIDFNVTGQVDGFIHSHYNGLLSVFSLDDIFGMAQMYTNGNIYDMNTFVVGVVTASGTQYLMVIDNPTKFGTFANSIMNGNQTNSIALNAFEDAFKNVFNINPANNGAANEANFVKLLDKMNTGLKMLKGSADLSNWSTLNQNSSGLVVPQNCP